MDRFYIDEHHVVARYLADRVTDEERAEFEAFYLEHLDVVQEMEAVARFKVGLMRLRDTGELARLLKLRPRYLQWQFIAAAAAVAVLILGSIVEFTRPVATPTLLAASIEALGASSGKSPALAGTYAILRTRGNSVDAEIPRSEIGQAVELRVLPEFAAEPARYRVRLSRVSADDLQEPVAELGGLVPAPDRFVSVFLSAARLTPGQYELVIGGDAGTDAQNLQSTFVVRVAQPF